jgi:hypothetical protein
MRLACQSESLRGAHFEAAHGAAVLAIPQDLSGKGISNNYVFGRKQNN